MAMLDNQMVMLILRVACYTNINSHPMTSSGTPGPATPMPWTWATAPAGCPVSCALDALDHAGPMGGHGKPRRNGGFVVNMLDL